MRRRTIKKVKEKEVENFSLVFFASPSGSRQLTLNSGRSLTIESSPANWVSVSITTSINGVTVSCNPNTLTTERNGVIVISDAVKEYHISVVQYGVLAVTPETFSFNSGGGSDIFEILGGSGNFTLTTSSSWLSVSGIGRNRTVIVSSNQSAENSSTITITDNTTGEIVTIQISINYYISINPTSYEFYPSGGTKEFEITTNADGWSYELSVNSWLIASQSGNKITVSASSNKTGEMRAGNITIQIFDSEIKAISTIQQNPISIINTLTFSHLSQTQTVPPSTLPSYDQNDYEWNPAESTNRGWWEVVQFISGGLFSIRRDENTETETRKAIVAINRLSTEEILYYGFGQYAKAYLLNDMIIQLLNIGKMGQAFNVQVYGGSTDFSLISVPSWAKMVSPTGTAFTFTVEYNQTTSVRTATCQFRDNITSIIYEFTITQKGEFY